MDVELGVGEDDARRLNAPYLKLLETGRPWVIAKWAMTLDGKIATPHRRQPLDLQRRSRGGSSMRCAAAMDAIVVGRETALQDDPLLTARPPGPRTAAAHRAGHAAPRSARKVQLVRTAREVPLLVAVGSERRRPIATGWAPPAARCGRSRRRSGRPA